MIEYAFRIFSDLLISRWKMEDAESIFLSKPVLLWPALWPHLEKKIAALPNSSRPQAYNLLAWLHYYYNSIYGGPYPENYGPLEEIDRKFRNAEITLSSGITLSVSPNCFNYLSPFYVISRCNQQKITSGRKRGELLIQFAYLERMAFATGQIKTPVARDSEFLEMISAPVITALKVAVPILIEIPDGAILERCINLFDGLESNSLNNTDNPCLQEIYYSVGLLYLDPYFSGKQLSFIEELHNAWIKRYYAQSQMDVYIQDNMPSCDEACTKAILYLKKALLVATEKNKDLITTALNNALQCKKALDEKASQFENQLQNDDEIPSVADRLAIVDDYIDSSPLIISSPSELIERYEHQTLFVLFRNEIASHLKLNPHISYEVYKKAQHVLDLFPNETVQEEHFQVGAQILFRLTIPDIKKQENAKCEEHLRLFNDYFSKTALVADDYFSNIITIALLDIRNCVGGPGPQMLLDTIEKITEVEQPLELIPLCQYSLNLSFFVNGNKCYHEGKYYDAIEQYSTGILTSINYGIHKNLKNLIANLTDCGLRGDDKTYSEAILKILQLHPLFAKNRLHYLDPIVNQSFKKLLTKAVEKDKRQKWIFTLMSTAKGFHFRSMLRNNSLVDFSDEQSLSLLKQIDMLFQESDVKFSSVGNKEFKKEELIGAYIATTAKLPGDSAFARFTNLQIEFDNYIQNRRIESLPAYPAYLTAGDVMSKIDDDTVFINYFIGESNEDYLCIYTHIITKTYNVVGFCILTEMPMAPSHIVDGEAQITADPLSLFVSIIREEIVLDPSGNSSISNAAQAKIQELANSLFTENIASTLARLWDSGKRKLCIWPHSAFHYVPFHLLPYKGGLLSDYWSVRIIPDLNLVTSTNAKKSSENRIAVLAMSFTVSNPLKLPQLNQALRHSENLASLFNTTPTVDDQLTKSSFLNELKNSRWVHLYTHGYLTASAPSFQCVFLHPENADDGIFYAHELIGLDLSNIDLLTLSACESGLGRFDEMDNLRGLTANLFIAGVSTIIATLWEAESSSSAFFFETFYECLKSGMGKLLAYTEAQRKTRVNYPEQRDWGAFFYLGKE